MHKMPQIRITATRLYAKASKSAFRSAPSEGHSSIRWSILHVKFTTSRSTIYTNYFGATVEQVRGASELLARVSFWTRRRGRSITSGTDDVTPAPAGSAGGFAKPPPATTTLATVAPPHVRRRPPGSHVRASVYITFYRSFIQAAGRIGTPPATAFMLFCSASAAAAWDNKTVTADEASARKRAMRLRREPHRKRHGR